LKITDQNKLLTWTNSSAGQRVPSINVISLEPNSISGKVTYNSIIKSDIVSTPDYGYFAIPPGGKSIINSEVDYLDITKLTTADFHSFRLALH
jgi:predicted naringenin-chalcone synthase